jgi:methylmalonyl-CoA mutase N-terminal domain/subunit
MKATAGTAKERWQRETLEPALKKAPEREAAFTTISGHPIDRLYTSDDVAGIDPVQDIGSPGAFPYTRGIHGSGYEGKLWTMRQFAGFGTPEETNGRYKALLKAGGTGLSVAFDLPTLMGRDPDHELSLGEVGKCGVSIASLADMECLFDAIDLGGITTSMTINSPAAMIFAMYLVVAEQQGVSWDRLSGTIQNDILKEFIAQKEFIYPPRPSMRLITDVFAFCTTEVPKWNTISVSGYHIREAGSTALQELAFTLRDGIEYVQWGIDAGLDVDAFVPRMSFFFNAHSDFFEEIAKYRAARNIWARVMRDRFHARTERSWKLRFHTQTAGVSLTAQQAYNNVVRTALCRQRRRRHWRCELSRCWPTRAVSPARWTRSGAPGSWRSSPARWKRAHGRTSTRSTRWEAWSRPLSAASRREKLRRVRTASSRRWSVGTRPSSA